ncbi:MAG: hypothetical protein ACR2PR_00245 [Pseudohongiellaceae bacterium]
MNKGDVIVGKCNHASLNGKQIEVSRIPASISRLPNGVANLTLRHDSVSADFSLDVCIASEHDLVGVEKEFVEISEKQKPVLDIKAIKKFSDDTSEFKSAIKYVDGICSYLYGVLIKEKSAGSSLDYDEYVGKFNRASEYLKAYNRPLAQTICGLVGFHFNHFADVISLAEVARVGQAASKFNNLLCGTIHDKEITVSSNINNFDIQLSDWSTERIIAWAVKDIDELAHDVNEIEKFAKNDIPEFDSLKVCILLAEIHLHLGNKEKALGYAKRLRNLSVSDIWAERFIQTLSGD